MGRRRTAVFIGGSSIASDCPGKGNRARIEKKIRKGRGHRFSDQTGRGPSPSMDGGAAHDDDTSLGGA